MYLHKGKFCRENDPATCSRGKNSCPPGVFGGWGCNGHCLPVPNIKEELDKTKALSKDNKQKIKEARRKLFVLQLKKLLLEYLGD